MITRAWVRPVNGLGRIHRLAGAIILADSGHAYASASASPD
jgi:hypothetical protein